MRGHKDKQTNQPESDGEWEDVDECIDLEDAEEEDSKMLKRLSEEIPEEAKVGGLVWNTKAVRCSVSIMKRFETP